jgi:hypothetical protein
MSTIGGIPIERIMDLVATAFEGGVGYWCQIVEFRKPPELVYRTDPEEVYRHIDYPVNEGGALILTEDPGVGGEDTGDRWVFDRAAIERGLTLMHEKAPYHWKNFVEENEDADTADAFVQYAVLGSVVYG